MSRQGDHVKSLFTMLYITERGDENDCVPDKREENWSQNCKKNGQGLVAGSISAMSDDIKSYQRPGPSLGVPGVTRNPILPS